MILVIEPDRVRVASVPRSDAYVQTPNRVFLVPLQDVPLYFGKTVEHPSVRDERMQDQGQKCHGSNPFLEEGPLG